MFVITLVQLYSSKPYFSNSLRQMVNKSGNGALKSRVIVDRDLVVQVLFSDVFVVVFLVWPADQGAVKYLRVGPARPGLIPAARQGSVGAGTSRVVRLPGVVRSETDNVAPTRRAQHVVDLLFCERHVLSGGNVQIGRLKAKMCYLVFEKKNGDNILKN